MMSVGAGQGVVAHPAQAGVGDSRRSPASGGELSRGLGRDRRAKLGRVDRDDPGEVVDVVEFEVLVHAEPLAQRAGEHAAAGGGPDDREFLERQADGPRRHSLAEDDVDAEIFHHRVDELLDGPGQAMDLVDEEDRPSDGVGQKRHDVHLLVERRPARDIELDAELVVQHGGERRLAQAGGAVEEDMRQRLAALVRGSQADLQPFGDGTLADHSHSRCGRSFSSPGSEVAARLSCLEADRRSSAFHESWAHASRRPPRLLLIEESETAWSRLSGQRGALQLLSTLQIDRFYHIGNGLEFLFAGENSIDRLAGLALVVAD